MSEVLGLLLIFSVIYAWYRNLTIREIAMKQSARACEKQSYQLLDGSVHLTGIGLAMCPGLRRCLRRRYGFTYSSDHVHRSRGVTIMAGEQLESIIFSPMTDKATQ
jgi:hypothetical protein